MAHANKYMLYVDKPKYTIMYCLFDIGFMSNFNISKKYLRNKYEIRTI